MPTPVVEVTLSLRPATPLPTRAGGRHMKQAEMLKRHAAHPRVRERLRQFAREHRLKLGTLDCGRNIARLAGAEADLAAAFPVRRGMGGRVPVCLADDVEAVLGLGPEHHTRRSTPLRDPHACHGRTLRDLAEAYDFPEPASAAGVTIGVLEFGGGFRRRDIEQFCRRNYVSIPQITEVFVEGGKNRPAPTEVLNELLDAMHQPAKLSSLDLQSARMQAAMYTMEVTMDLEILAALAPGAHIVVYFAPSDKQFHALHSAVYDHIHKPSVLSVSWSEPEPGIPAGALRAMNRLLRVAAHLGITVCASSGDQGAKNGSQDGSPTVNFPASSPFSLGCGGTTPHFAKRGGRLRVMRETVWNSVYLKIHGASGGGISRVLPVPLWQRAAHVPMNPSGRRGRGVPDVAAAADPRFGCELLIAGRPYSSSGTSAVAPLWAALIARCNAALGRRCGHINPLLYKHASQSATCLRPVTRGTNGAYKAGPGWNPCTGCGTPIGTELLRALERAHHD